MMGVEEPVDKDASLERHGEATVRISSQILPATRRTLQKNEMAESVVRETRPAAPTLDRTELQRGRRMLGLLRSTLSNPLSTTKHVQQHTVEAEEAAAAKRRAVDERLALKLAEEKARLREEVEREQEERRQRLEALKREREEAELTRLEERWQRQRENVLAFRRTTTLPSLCWLPAVLTSHEDGDVFDGVPEGPDPERLMEIEE